MKRDVGSRVLLWVCGVVAFSVVGAGTIAVEPVPKRTKGAVPGVAEMIAASTDVWGEAAMRQPDGASYEFFRDLLPPLRYVNAAFRHYPISLSAPLAEQKARLISDGSAVNADPKQRMWHKIGFPVAFGVADSREPFGADLDRLDGPRFAEGYLPIVQMAYRHDGARYEQEVFAAVEPELAARGVVFVKFTLADGSRGRLTADIDVSERLKAEDGAVCDKDGKLMVCYDETWAWEHFGQRLTTVFSESRNAVLAICSKPENFSIPALTLADYEKHRQACAKQWNDLLTEGVCFETPEAIVNNAWRSIVIANLINAIDDQMNYSVGNAYARLCEVESGDPARATMLFGHPEITRRFIGPLLEFDRHITRFHIAGQKLQLLTHYYWVTRDAEYLREREADWKKVVQFILDSRQEPHGLISGDNYAADIHTPICSLRSNANCWRGLRDMAVVLEELGERKEADRLHREANEYRENILNAVTANERRDTDPLFIPVALFADEPAHSPLTATRQGSYYDLVAPYIIDSGIFRYNSPRENALLAYLEQHGGIAMGMVRCQPHRGEFNKQPGVNPLYTWRFRLAQLRRDEREKALVGFYGQLAQGMTRDTFIGGEGCRFLHGDRYGRSLYLPPNSAANGTFLLTLRYLMIQDWDLDQDGRPDTLRLLYGAPRRWLRDGKVIRLEKAPTAFGEVSLEVHSRLQASEVEVRLVAPTRKPDRCLLRLPLPDGWVVSGAEIDGAKLPIGEGGAVDLTGRSGAFTLGFKVRSTGVDQR